jgi:hypothetical protein
MPKAVFITHPLAVGLGLAFVVRRSIPTKSGLLFFFTKLLKCLINDLSFKPKKVQFCNNFMYPVNYNPIAII